MIARRIRPMTPNRPDASKKEHLVRRRTRPGLAIAAACLAATHPVLATPGIGAGLHRACMIESARRAAAPVAPVAQTAPIASSGADPRADQTRTWIVERLVAIGRSETQALAVADGLNIDDLAVLLANPEMMQPAAGMSHQTQAYIIGAILIGGIVALAIAGEGSVTVN